MNVNDFPLQWFAVTLEDGASEYILYLYLYWSNIILPYQEPLEQIGNFIQYTIYIVQALSDEILYSENT